MRPPQLHGPLLVGSCSMHIAKLLLHIDPARQLAPICLRNSSRSDDRTRYSNASFWSWDYTEECHSLLRRSVPPLWQFRWAAVVENPRPLSRPARRVRALALSGLLSGVAQQSAKARRHEPALHRGL